MPSDEALVPVVTQEKGGPKKVALGPSPHYIYGNKILDSQL